MISCLNAVINVLFIKKYLYNILTKKNLLGILVNLTVL